MARQCPHFDTHNGVCGCPEFWKPTQRLLADRNQLHDKSNTRDSRNTTAQHSNLGVNSTPLSRCTKIQQTTPAPSGPPKETCFFWYHGLCRRGEGCERPHEAHPTWPIPPPPGFRHYQPCTLPLCPLRTDLENSKKPQEYQRRDRNMGGQLDGAAFSRATAGESSPDDHGNNNTDTDLIEDNEEIPTFSTQQTPDTSVRHIPVAIALASDVHKEGTVQEGEVRGQQGLENYSLDETDYIDLSQLLSPPSTPLVQEDALLSISHSGTVSKRRPPPSKNSPDVANKRSQPVKDTPPHFSEATSVVQQPRIMSQWDIKPPCVGSDDIHFDPAVTRLTRVHDASSLPLPICTTDKVDTSFALQDFNPPKGPRSMRAVPPICFFFYHKGHCRPKRGRRCDYLHTMDTSQQSVSLPYGIENHDPTCPLPLCPIQLQRPNQVKQEPDVYNQSQIRNTPRTPPRTSMSPFNGTEDSSPRDMILSVRGRPPRGMLGQALPQLTGVARQRFKEQKRRMEQVQYDNGIDPFAATSLVHPPSKMQGKQSKRKRRGDKKRARANAGEGLRSQTEEHSVQQVLHNQPNAFSKQPLSPYFKPKDEFLEELPVSTVASRLSNPSKKMKKKRDKRPLHSKRAEDLWLEDLVKEESVQGPRPHDACDLEPTWTLEGFPSSPEAPPSHVADNKGQVSIEKALEMVSTMNKDHRKWRPLTTSLQKTTLETAVSFEFSQQSLGMTAEQRRAELYAVQKRDSESHKNSRRVSHGGKEHAQDRGSVSAIVNNSDYRIGADRENNQRCQRCHQSQMTCSCHILYLRRGDVDHGAVGSMNRNGSNKREDFNSDTAVDINSTVGSRTSETGQRLDWDTDLVRSLFGEIE